MSKESPFSLNRFEYEREHLYSLPAETFPKLEEMKPTYLVGTRGTGKTTLLHALSWKERWLNDSLRIQLGNNVFAKEYIGVYLKLPEYQLARIEQWLATEDPNDRASVLGLYIDLIWLELLAASLVELLLVKVFRAEPAAEHDLVATILGTHPELTKIFGKTDPHTLKQLANVMRALRREVETSASIKENPKYMLQSLPLDQVGGFGRSLAELLAQFCNDHCGKKNASWYFKIAMDEGEYVSPFQQLVLNTSVRLSKRPISLVASYVRPPKDSTTTLLHGLTLQEADRHLVVLDDMTDKEFQNLAEGVASVRIRAKLPSHTTRFSTVRLLGQLDIDGLIENILKNSVNPKAKHLLKISNDLRKEPFFAEVFDDDQESGSSNRKRNRPSLLYKAYLIDRLKIKIPSPEENWQRRRQDSAELRKKIVAAYLSICRELNVQVRYGFAEMVLQMSDKCVRDFLAQIHEIFQEARLELKDFLRKLVPLPKQDKALKRASRQKRESIAKSGVDSPLEIGRLIDGLGQITAIVQTSGPDYANLRSPERGRFRLGIRTSEEATKSHLLGLLAEAAEAGFLRIVKQEESVWEFQVHCSLAAEYGFSYRGAYYPTSITFVDLRDLSADGDSDKRQANIKQIGARLSGEEQLTASSQMTLL